MPGGSGLKWRQVAPSGGGWRPVTSVLGLRLYAYAPLSRPLFAQDQDQSGDSNADRGKRSKCSLVHGVCVPGEAVRGDTYLPAPLCHVERHSVEGSE